MTKAVNIAAIEETTKTAWTEWVTFLDGIGARDMTHKEIAERAYERLESMGEQGGWWAQSITVAYEQHIGRRQPGQRSDGTFEVSVSKVIAGSMDDAMRLWTKAVTGKAEFDKVKIASEPTMTQTDKRRHWACNLEDSSRLNADVYPKSIGKVTLTIIHTKLHDSKAVDRWRSFWKATLETLPN
jgi:hypothetical protein